MSRVDYRRKALLARIHTTIDTFYMQQEVDWNYDIRNILDRILQLGMEELEFGEGKRIDRGLMIVRRPSGEELEIEAGWRVDEEDIEFSRTIVDETLSKGEPVLCENARQDPRFAKSESIQHLDILSLLCVPIQADTTTLGAIYIERRDAAHLFLSEDRDFLGEFADTIAPYIKTALIHQAHVGEINDLKAALEGGAGLPNIIGRSKPMKKAFELARIAASVEKTVLITGESGSGKELLARAIHSEGRRGEKPFVVVDCSALSESLLESELFGHRKGSFTGAVSDRIGAFENADGGTIFLDEISDASKSMQQQLRRVLQEGEIRRVGDTDHIKVDVRIIAATNRHLPDEVDGGRFIHDLYHRLHQFPIRMPALRERKEDISILVDHFIANSGDRKIPLVRGISSEALQLLMTRDWRANNVRELRNVVELAVDLASTDQVDLATLRRTLEIREEPVPDELAGTSSMALLGSSGDCLYLDRSRTRMLFENTPRDVPKEDRPYYRVQKEFSGKLIVESLRHNDWKLRPAARLLGISPVKLRQDFRQFLETLLVDNVGNGGRESVAELLEMPPQTLERKLKDLGVPMPTQSHQGEQSQPTEGSDDSESQEGAA